MKKISIISLGWLGENLYSFLDGKYDCSGAYKTTPKGLCFEYQFDIMNYSQIPGFILDSDIIFINLPPSVIENLDKFEKFIKSVNSKRILLISSTSVYENLSSANEKSKLRLTSHRASKQFFIEEIIRNNCSDFFILRCAGLYGKERHPGKYLSGKNNISGANQPVNLIGLNDLLNLIERNLENRELNLLNAVNRNHPLKKDYYLSYCKKNNLDEPLFNDQENEIKRIVETCYSDFFIDTALP